MGRLNLRANADISICKLSYMCPHYSPLSSDSVSSAFVSLSFIWDHLPRPSPKFMPSDIFPPTMHRRTAPLLCLPSCTAAASAYSLSVVSTWLPALGSKKTFFLEEICCSRPLAAQACRTSSQYPNEGKKTTTPCT